MNYFKLNPADTVNGKGVRVSLFVSGCTHNCKGCFAKAEQNFNYGERFTDDHFFVLLSCLDKDYISGLSILGGDPLAPKNIDFIKMGRYDSTKPNVEKIPDKNTGIILATTNQRIVPIHA